jgi:uncharacterized Zn finger protein
MNRNDDPDDEDAITRQQLLGEEWWTSAFLALMSPGRDSSELAKGQKLAERGQVIIRGIFPGEVDAVVLGAVGGSRKVSLWFNDLEDDWLIIYRLFTIRQDLFSRLMKHDFSSELNDLLAEAGISIIPSAMTDLDYRCDCESDHHTCKHIVATYLALGKFINEDPLTLFLLRGKTREEIISGVAESANCNSPQDEDEDTRNSGMDKKDIIDTRPDKYYDPGPEFDSIRIRKGFVPGKEVEIIRILGHSPFRLGNTDLADLIAASYQKAARFLQERGRSGRNCSQENSDR